MRVPPLMTKQMMVFLCLWRLRVYFCAVVVWTSFFLRSCGRVCARLYARVLRRYTACRHAPRALRLLSRSLVAMETVWVGRMPQGIRRAHRGHKFKGHVGDRQILQKTKNKGNSSLVAKPKKNHFVILLFILLFMLS